MEEGSKKLGEFFNKWIAHAITTEDYQRKHFEKFGYDALLEACRKFGAKVLIPNPQDGKVD